MSNNTRLLAALATWESWDEHLSSPPQVKYQFKGGLTNQSFYIASEDGRAYVLRLHNPNSHILGIDRKREAKILKVVHALGCSPRLVYLDGIDAFSVLTYIPGNIWTKSELQNQAKQTALLELIDKYQALKVNLPAMDYLAYLDMYWDEYQKHYPRAVELKNLAWQDFRLRLTRFQSQRSERCLVHHDLVPENIIENEDGIHIIDWEYAALGFQELDHFYLNTDTRQLQSRRNEASADSVISELQQWLSDLWRAIQKVQKAGYGTHE